MTRLMDPTGRLAFTADFKRQVSIDQAWVKTQTKSKPNVGLASLRQTEKKVTLRRLEKPIYAVLGRRHLAIKAQ